MLENQDVNLMICRNKRYEMENFIYTLKQLLQDIEVKCTLLINSDAKSDILLKIQNIENLFYNEHPNIYNIDFLIAQFTELMDINNIVSKKSNTYSNAESLFEKLKLAFNSLDPENLKQREIIEKYGDIYKSSLQAIAEAISRNEQIIPIELNGKIEKIITQMKGEAQSI